MNALQDKFNQFSIIAFPCNQFGLQEPGANGDEIVNGIRFVRPGKGYVPNFELFKKIDVNGENEHPLYTYLKTYCPATRTDFSKKANLYYEPLRENDVRWNWEKFLIDSKGKVVARYDSSTVPADIEPDVRRLLKQGYI